MEERGGGGSHQIDVLPSSAARTPLIVKTSSPRKGSLCKSLILHSFLFLAIGGTLVAAGNFMLSSLSSPPRLFRRDTARPLAKLPHPVVLLVSADGFRFGYQFKTPTPNIGRLMAAGAMAENGLIPVFPTLTFPNHYSIVTGLYPPYHGIVSNYFVDPVSGGEFTTKSHDPKWWLGEPLWQTVAAAGLNAAAYFWAGSEVVKGSWTCPPRFCPKYNASVPFEERVETILSYFDLPEDEIPSFIGLYLEDPDKQGHQVGPDDPRVTEAVARVDLAIGSLIAGLEKRRIFNDVTMIFVGDHGMVATCGKKIIYLEDLAPWVQIPDDWAKFTGSLLAMQPSATVSAAEVVEKMREGLNSGKVENGEYLQVYLKEDLPARLQYSDSSRISSIIGLVAEGFNVAVRRTNSCECGGDHGYDNAAFSMRTMFVGHGPRFRKGQKVASFMNVEIYNLVTSILEIKGAPNNGTSSFAESVLLPSY